MLELLRIHNLALIEDVSMDFTAGMNVLTGETGAGKSFILKALNFVTGEKLGPELVRPGKEKAVVEALFIIDGQEKILRRELIAETGRSRLYINNQLSSQEQVKELRAALIVHTSQHGQQKLLQHAYHAKMLDDFMQHPDLIHVKDSLVKDLHACVVHRNALDKKMADLEVKRDVFEFQLQEIQKVAPKPNEEEELDTLRQASRNHADISEGAETLLTLLLGSSNSSGLISQLASVDRPLGKLALANEQFSNFSEGLATAHSLFKDMEAIARTAASKGQQDIDIEKIESRLYELAQLKRKLRRSLPEIVNLEAEIAENLSFLDSCQFEKKQLILQEQEKCDALAALLLKLNDARKKTAITFASQLQTELKKLGFSEHIAIIFDFIPHRLHPDREDCCELRARLLWQPNPGQPPQPLDQIASGGELSRFLLAVVTLLSQKTDESPTLIFDEVDTGVGGLTLNSVATALEELAATRQMLLITHWPQLAAKARHHFVIQKEIVDGLTYTTCTELSGNAIAKELSRMAGGGEQGDALARELRP